MTTTTTETIVCCTCDLPAPPTVPKKKPQKHSERAKLIFSVARIHGMTKHKFQGTDYRLRKLGIIYITAVLQKLCCEILCLAIEEARRIKRIRITGYNVSCVVADNAVFSQLLKIDAPETFTEHQAKFRKHKMIAPSSSSDPVLPETKVQVPEFVEPKKRKRAAPKSTGNSKRKKKGVANIQYDLMVPTPVDPNHSLSAMDLLIQRHPLTA